MRVKQGILFALLVVCTLGYIEARPSASSWQDSGNSPQAPVLGLFPVFYPPAQDTTATTYVFEGNAYAGGVGRPECTVMLCKNYANWLQVWWYKFFGTYISESTLYNGSCRFEHMTPTQIERMINDTMRNSNICSGTCVPGSTILQPKQVPPGKDYVRSFMFGQGPTFAEFDEANAYCKDNMSMVVKWVKWDPSTPFLSPYVGTTLWEKTMQRTRAKCYLDLNIIPVYIFYANSTPTAVDPAKVGQFAANFKDTSGVEVGPVVISPEFAYNLNKIGGPARIAQSIINIKAACSTCLIMLSPPEEDMASIDAIFNYDPNLREKVNIIGQSWTLSKDENCSFYGSLKKKLDFSKAVLAKYQKPTLWAYLAAANASNDKKTCNWTAGDIADAFDMIYINSPGLVSAGGIGIGHYEFLEGPDPTYNCSSPNCDFGLMKIVNNAEVQKQPMFNRWFNRCNGYYQVDVNSSGIIENMSRVPLVFNFYGDNGTECNLIPNLGPYRMMRLSTTPEAAGPATMAKPPEVYTCDRCFGNLSFLPKSPGYPFALPSAWYGTYNSQKIWFDDLHLALGWHTIAVPPADILCDKFRLTIRKQSETACKWELDPLFVRAVVDRDSGYNQCKVRFTYWSDPNCNVGNPLPIPFVSDPTGVCPPQAVPPSCPKPGGGFEPCKPCSFGLMRCENFPYTQQSYTAGGPNGCGDKFNPFDVGMGTCCGANSLCNAVDTAVNWAFSSGRDVPLHLSNPATPAIVAKDNWMFDARRKWTVFLAALVIYYHQGSTSELDYAYTHWQSTKYCPSSTRIPYSFQGWPPLGPAKTFIWDYCSVYNTTNDTWSGYSPDPYDACLGASDSASDCHIGCCAHSSVPDTIAGYWPTPNGRTALRTTVLASRFDTSSPEFANMQSCLTAPECCQGTTGNVCPLGFSLHNGATYRCDAPTPTCCGSSFFEHLCCLEPYACEVLFEYNKTVNTCASGKTCMKPLTGP